VVDGRNRGILLYRSTLFGNAMFGKLTRNILPISYPLKPSGGEGQPPAIYFSPFYQTIFKTFVLNEKYKQNSINIFVGTISVIIQRNYII